MKLGLSLREHRLRPYERKQGFVGEIWVEEGRGKQVIGLKKLHNEELHGLYSLQILTTRVINKK